MKRKMDAEKKRNYWEIGKYTKEQMKQRKCRGRTGMPIRRLKDLCKGRIKEISKKKFENQGYMFENGKRMNGRVKQKRKRKKRNKKIKRGSTVMVIWKKYFVQSKK